MKFPVISSLILLAAAPSVVLSHDFNICKGHTDQIGVESVDFQPDPPQSGKGLTVTVKGTPSVDIVEGTILKVDVKVYGIVMDSQTMDICGEGLLTCPHPIGKKFSVQVTQDIPEGTPRHVSATVKMSVTTPQGSTLSCLESTVEVESSQMLEAHNSARFAFEKWTKMFPHVKANFDVFASNWARIFQHNANKDKTFTMEMNEFGSMTPEEFVATRMGIRGDPTKERSRDHVAKVYLRNEVSLADPPAAVDWVERGVVTRVKNQGSCGSCWAFSAIGSVESAFAIKTGKLVEFSEQELVSCDTVDSACNGGLMDNAFEWIEHNTNGLCTEQDFPYTSGTTGARGICDKASCEPVQGSVPSSFEDVPPNEQALLAAVANHGPVSVAIEADQSAFQFYRSGVLTGTCGSHLDHGVLLVGYGVDEATGLKFWKVKNSWGAAWGESGYIRIQRGKRWIKGGECGIASAASYPVF